MASSTSLTRFDFSMATPFATWAVTMNSRRYTVSETAVAAAIRPPRSSPTCSSCGAGAENAAAICESSRPAARNAAVVDSTASACPTMPTIWSSSRSA